MRHTHHSTPIIVLASLITMFGCDDDAEPIELSNINARLSESITTVAIVSWTTSRPTVGWVEFGRSGVDEMSTPIESEPSEQHEAVLLGLTPEQEWNYRVVAQDGDQETVSDTFTITTGSIPSELPVISMTGADHDLYTVVSILGSSDAVVIINPEGQYVWYHFDNRDLDIYRARLSVDGESVIYNAGSVSGDPSDQSQIVRVSLDGEQEDSIDVPLLAHDFVEHPDGTLGMIVVEFRDHEGVAYRGDQLVEITPDGTQNVVWSAWDCYDPAVTFGDDLEHGWTFSNALDYDAEEDVYYLGMRNFSSIVRISRETWECESAFGGAANTYEFTPGSARFQHQHQFDWTGESIVIFDNDGATGHVSRVIEYQIDPVNQTADEIWQYIADPTIFSFVLGDVTRLANGDTLVNWSVAGQIERVSPSGDVNWQLNTELGFAFGFHTLTGDLYENI